MNKLMKKHQGLKQKQKQVQCLPSIKFLLFPFFWFLRTQIKKNSSNEVKHQIALDDVKRIFSIENGLNENGICYSFSRDECAVNGLISNQ